MARRQLLRRKVVSGKESHRGRRDCLAPGRVFGEVVDSDVPAPRTGPLLVDPCCIPAPEVPAIGWGRHSAGCPAFQRQSSADRQ
jgi:hypothetical protein